MALDIYIPDLEKRFDATSDDAFDWKPQFNIPPKTDLKYPIIAKVDGQTKIKPALWGMIPSYASDPSVRLKYETFNAKAEGVEESRVYSNSFKKNQMCLVPITGFYEWYKKVKPSQPVFIHHRSEKISSLAGIWSTWTNKEAGEIINSFTIITGPARKFMGQVHHRQPYLLPREKEANWIDPRITPQNKLKGILDLDTDEIFSAYLVDRQFVSYGKEVPECIMPIQASLSELLQSKDLT